ncbi:hypothetical protein Drorol1_Dr00016945 [Drosera rotundifolia]
MDEFEVGGIRGKDAAALGSVQFGDNSSEGAVFDASQYAFFGNDTVEEVELGGLEDEEEDIPAAAFDEEDYQFQENEGDGLVSSSDIDDLANTFSKINKVVIEPRQSGIIGDGESRESSSAAEWAQDANYLAWYEQNIRADAGNVPEAKRWSSQPYSPSDALADSKSLYRTSSYPEPQPQLLGQNFSSEPIPVPKSPYPPYPPTGSRSQQSSLNPHPTHFGRGSPIGLPSHSSFSGPLSSLPHGPRFGGNLPQFSPPGQLIRSGPPSQWVNQTNMYPGDRSNPLNMLQRPSAHQNGLMPPQLMAHQQLQQNRLQHPVRPPFLHAPSYGQLLSASPPMNRFDSALGFPDMRDQLSRPALRNRPFLRPQQNFDIYGQRSDSGWPQFRSKYMTSEEIDNILRMQLVATHSNDPYTDDYYHQACLAKRSAGAQLKHHFSPTQLRDFPAHGRPSNEPHAFLQVEALGRMPFSSIRRPRPLLEVDSPKSSVSGGGEQKVSERPLEQEPLLVARIIIEDCMCLLLDVDDIDRFLKFNQFPDGGITLKQKRHAQLNELATSLLLADPFGKDGSAAGLVPKDDVLFLRVVSLPKGRKLLSRLLQTLLPSDELLRVVCMGIFRHLRFLFGAPPPNPASAEALLNLSATVVACVRSMDLDALSACLAAVVCSSEQPPLRPIGSPAGDGASKLLITVLDRATELLRDPHGTGTYNMPNRSFWQASFDEFFALLTKYCMNKYDVIVQPLLRQASPHMDTVQSDLAKAIKMEMPVELLRASLPHTNEQQRQVLLDFAQRTLPDQGYGNGHGGFKMS